MQEPRSVIAVDLRNVSYGEWLAFVFDHEPLPDGADIGRAWYNANVLEIEAGPARQVSYLTRVFESPEVLAGRYTTNQIEQGFWFMLGATSGQEAFRDALWDAAVPWAEREACIRAVPTLYERLFPRDEDNEGIPFMLWDLLADDYGHKLRNPAADEEDRRVQGAMLEAMRQMLLSSDSPIAQRAGLHGLFHLAHPMGHALIRTYLESRWGISASLRTYAEQVVRGDAL